MTHPNCTEEVRHQYEQYPYPPRKPEQEKQRLNMTAMDMIERLNYYCFEGKQDFSDFHILVAGGGTGDATIFLAEQLKHHNVAITHLDLSEASIAIAKERAEIRALENITFIQGSLLEVAEMQLGAFDYINASGVLHHLDDPRAGLTALASVLKDDGAMGVMVYGQYGRTGIYHIQTLMDVVNQHAKDTQEKVDNCKAILNSLPSTNWFKRGNDHPESDHHTYGDVGIYDLFLHATDKPFTVDALYAWVAECGLVLRDFCPSKRLPRQVYDPTSFIKDKTLQEKIASKDGITQQAIAELIYGGIDKHSVYLSKKESKKPSAYDGNMIPFFNYAIGIDNPYETIYTSIQNFMHQSPDQPIPMQFKMHQTACQVMLEPTTRTLSMFKYLDGKRTISELCNAIRKDSIDGPSDEVLSAELESVIEKFNSAFDMIFLKHKSVGW